MEEGSSLVAMGVLNVGLVAISGESVAMDVEVVDIKNVTLRVAICFCGHGSWVGGQGEVDVPQGFHPLSPQCPQMMLKLTLLSLLHWLVVLRFSFPIVLLGNTLTFTARNSLEAEGEQDVSPCPHNPMFQHLITPNSHPSVSHLNRVLCSWVTSMVTFMVHGHLQLLPCPLSLPSCVSLTISRCPPPSPCPLLMSHHHGHLEHLHIPSRVLPMSPPPSPHYIAHLHVPSSIFLSPSPPPCPLHMCHHHVLVTSTIFSCP